MSEAAARDSGPKQKGPISKDIGPFHYYCRQRPTLPRSFPRSTIGGIRLNFRVRNGNGCDPDPMTTGILVPEPCSGNSSAWGFLLRSRCELQSTRPQWLVDRSADGAKAESSQTIFFRKNHSTLHVERTTEHPANGSFTNHFTQLFLRALGTLCSGRSPKRKVYGQASRLISIGKLNVSPRLHTRPITW